MKRFVAALCAGALAMACAAPASALTQDEQTEAQIGQQVYQQLQKKGEIVTSSPYYNVLNPIAQRIKSVADQRYFTPFHFILVNEKQPNAFSVPGGNVYVTTSMMSFVHNKEELAGVLCHEVSHDVHHDVLNVYQKDQRLSLYATGLSILLGGRSQIANSLINLGANVQAMKFSRDVEHNADMTGAHICAQAEISPWGMVWLMKQFEASPSSNPPEFLSDHPSDSHRVSDLENLFASEPGTFAKFNSDVAYATPINYSGFKNQFKGGYATTPQRIAPVSNTAGSCPPNWKFCQ